MKLSNSKVEKEVITTEERRKCGREGEELDKAAKDMEEEKR